VKYIPILNGHKNSFPTFLWISLKNCLSLTEINTLIRVKINFNLNKIKYQYLNNFISFNLHLNVFNPLVILQTLYH
jgi:hypothetical protein